MLLHIHPSNFDYVFSTYPLLQPFLNFRHFFTIKFRTPVERIGEHNILEQWKRESELIRKSHRVELTPADWNIVQQIRRALYEKMKEHFDRINVPYQKKTFLTGTFMSVGYVTYDMTNYKERIQEMQDALDEIATRYHYVIGKGFQKNRKANEKSTDDVIKTKQSAGSSIKDAVPLRFYDS